MFVWELLVIFMLILLNGVFAMSEMAVVSSRRARLKMMVTRRGSHGAAMALRLIDDPSRFLSTVQIGITLIGTVAGAYGGATLGEELGTWLNSFPLLNPYGEEVGFGIVVIAITYFSLIFGELVPKRVALHSPERIAIIVAGPMMAISKVAAPLVWLLKIAIDAVLRLLKRDAARETSVTHDEVKSLITEGTLAGIFAPQEREMIEGVLRLADRAVRVIMTSRYDVVWLDANDEPEQVRRKIAEAGFSHYPVCRGALDEIVGIVHTKDLLDAALRGDSFSLGKYVVEPMVVPEGTPSLYLLEQFKKTGIHIAIIVDEFGTVEGIATLTDIMESIVGELPEQGETAPPEAVRRQDGSWLVDGMMPMDEFEDRVGIHGLHAPDKYETVGGFVLHVLGRFPVTSDHFKYEGIRFEVVDIDGRRVDKVLVHPPSSGHLGGKPNPRVD